MAISAEWIELGTDNMEEPVYFRKDHIYDMAWASEKSKVDLTDYLVAAAPFGGPIALTRDPKKLFAAPERAKPTIWVYTAAGRPITHFEWRGGAILTMGWSAQEELVVVCKDGSVMIHSVYGELIKSFVFDCSDQDRGADQECILGKVYSKGVVVVTNKPAVWAVQDLEDANPELLTELCTIDELVAMDVIPPEFSADETLKVIVSPASEGEGKLYFAKSDEEIEMRVGDYPHSCVAVSPDGLRTATFNEAGTIIVSYSDPDSKKKPLSKFDTVRQNTDKRVNPCTQLAWCGTDCVVCLWCPESTGLEQSLVLLVGPRGHSQHFTVEGPAVLVTEVDGVRIISNTGTDFLQRVSDTTQGIFRIGSTKPSAQLFDAWQDYENMRASSVKNVRAIGAQLNEAVETCIRAAGFEWKSDMQKQLLRAASYGKCFCDNFEADRFVEMCKHLRVLNALRQPEVGMPLTHTQLQALAPDVAVSRLINRRHHCLAFKICEFFDIKKGPERVLVHWACEKVKSNEADSAVRDAIVQKLNQCPGASYAQVATTALHMGKKNLAILLLEHEPRAAEQVPLLLGMKEDERALQKATESGDTDLIYLVILSMRKMQDQTRLIEILQRFPQARDLFVAYCKEQDPEFLENYYDKAQQLHLAAQLSIRQYLDVSDVTQKRLYLEKAKRLFENKRPADAKATEEQMKLLKEQEDLERKTGLPEFMGLSLTDTLSFLFEKMPKKDDANKLASKLVKEFGVPTKRLCWIKLRALCKSKDWEAFEKFAKEKPPIGYRPFVEELLKYNQETLAIKLVPKIPEQASRVELWCQMKRWQEAAHDAMSDPGLAREVQIRCPVPEIKQQLEAAMR